MLPARPAQKASIDNMHRVRAQPLCCIMQGKATIEDSGAFAELSAAHCRVSLVQGIAPELQRGAQHGDGSQSTAAVHLQKTGHTQQGPHARYQGPAT